MPFATQASAGSPRRDSQPVRARPEPRQGAYFVKYLARAVSGIGEATAQKLWNAHGAGLYKILAGKDPSPLVPILGDTRAVELLETYKEEMEERDVAVWLDEHRFDTRLANKVVHVWGKNGAALLKRNPYVMLTFAPWEGVDDAARRIGIALDDPRRLIGAVEGALYARLPQGHTAVSRTVLARAVQEMLGGSADLAEQAIDEALREGGAVTVPDGRLQPAGAAVMERYVETRIRELQQASRQEDLFQAAVSDQDIAAAIARFEATQAYVLTDEQRAAVVLAVNDGFGLILGGAGVGKTTVLRAAWVVCEAQGRQIKQMALSGRAAQRMREATGRQAYTIAGFLREIMQSKADIRAGTLLVIDEASMLDLPTTYRILRAMPAGARLLLVGDPAQLPPIGFGLLLHVAAKSGVPKVTLTKIYRQAESTGIPVVAAAVRAGTMPVLPLYNGPRPGVSILPCVSDQLHNMLTDILADFDGQDECQILAPLRAGETGVNGINAYLHAICRAGRSCIPERDIALGEPVVWTKNDWTLGLMNGSLGRIVDISDAGVTAEFEGVIHQFTDWAAVQPMELAHAITVHKAQGSQFRRVIVPVFPSKILDRTLIYTAITRATEQVVLVGDAGALRRAVIATPNPDQRAVALRL